MIEIKDLCVGYGKKSVLEGLCESFEQGKLTSVIGTNGCGKSTLLKSMLGIIPMFDGNISIDGEDLSCLKRSEIAKKISYLSQGRSIPDMTVEQMVLLGRFPYLDYPRRYGKKDRDIAFAAMERLGIEELSDTPLYALSGGMRQNVYIAMAIAQNTDYILLDEPNTYLDIAHQLELMRILRELAEGGKGIIAVMHDLPMAFDFSDSVAIIDEKKIAIQGDPKEICFSSQIERIFGVSLKCSDGKYSYFYGK